jgi:hypothetical protein
VLITSADEIVSKFPFFPDLHRMLSTRPNVTPIVITTGVGPAGKKTLHYQAPSKDEDEHEEDEHEGHPASPPSQVFSATQMQQFWTLQEAFDAASFPTSQSFADHFADSFPSNFDLDSEKEKSSSTFDFNSESDFIKVKGGVCYTPNSYFKVLTFS